VNKLSSINLNRLAVFVSVAESSSLTAAAVKLGIAKTMVSAHMQRLEAELGVSLLVRTTRRLSLTEAGEAFYLATRRILGEIEDAVSQAGSTSAEPRGTLRVTAPIDYGAAIVTPALVALRERHPELRVDLILDDTRFDLIAEGIDVAIRLGRLPDSSHQAVVVGRYVKWLVASPLFLQHHTGLRMSSELSRLPFISMSVLARPLSFVFEGPAGETCPVHFKSSFSANTANACRAAALAGGGLAVLTDFSTREDIAAGRLVRVLPKWTIPKSDIHAVFPAARHRSVKVRILIDALKEQAGLAAYDQARLEARIPQSFEVQADGKARSRKRTAAKAL
jgi:DNA-binding transcriptional LysR family regulator